MSNRPLRLSCVLILALFLCSSGPVAADPARGDSRCEEFEGAARGLCNAWYHMGCDGDPRPGRGCERVAANFARASGGRTLPLREPLLGCLGWTGTELEFYSVTPEDGEVEVLGPVGAWDGFAGMAVDAAAGRLYVAGLLGGQWILRVHDSSTFDLIEEFETSGPQLGLQISSTGELLSLRWNGSEEQLMSLDPTTREEQVLGTIGDLTSWAGLTALDAVAGTLHVEGNAGSLRKLWSLDAGTGELLGEMESEDALAGLQVNADGDPLYLRWNGTEEELVRLDWEAGSTEVIGVVDQLETWSGITALSPTNNRLHVFGRDAAGDAFLWTLDASTGELLNTADHWDVGPWACRAW